MITRGAPAKGSAVYKFIKWIQVNAAAQKIISSEWVPLK